MLSTGSGIYGLSILLVAIVACGGTSSAVGYESPEPTFGEHKGALVGGQREHGYPAVGKLSTDRGRCTATLISPRHLLTARHCVGPDTDPVRVTFYSQLPSGSFYAEAEALFRVGGRQEDILVIRLDREATNITPIPARARALSQADLGEQVLLIGYGLDASNTTGLKNSAPSTIDEIGPTRLGVSTAACPGDSGGPILYEGEVAGVIIGGLCNAGGSAGLRADAFAALIESGLRGGCGGAGEPCCRALECKAPGTACALSGSWPGVCTLGGCRVNVGEYYAEYFTNPALSGSPEMVRCEVAVDHDWATGSPSSEIPSDGFSARWQGLQRVAQNTSYRYDLTIDDGARLFVDDVSIIDAWTDQSEPITVSATVNESSSAYRLVRLEYYESTGTAVAKANVTVVEPIIPSNPDPGTPGPQVVEPGNPSDPDSGRPRTGCSATGHHEATGCVFLLAFALRRRRLSVWR